MPITPEEFDVRAEKGDEYELHECERRLNGIKASVTALRRHYQSINGHSMGVVNALSNLETETTRIINDMKSRHPTQTKKKEKSKERFLP